MCDEMIAQTDESKDVPDVPDAPKPEAPDRVPPQAPQLPKRLLVIETDGITVQAKFCSMSLLEAQMAVEKIRAHLQGIQRTAEQAVLAAEQRAAQVPQAPSQPPQADPQADPQAPAEGAEPG